MEGRKEADIQNTREGSVPAKATFNMTVLFFYSTLEIYIFMIPKVLTLIN